MTRKLYKITMLCLLLPIISYAAEKAPFGGKLITGNPPKIVLQRLDGSEITRYYPEGDWFLTKTATGSNKMAVPTYVKTTKPLTFNYTSLNGQQYFTIDMKNWFKSNPLTQNISSSNGTDVTQTNILQITNLNKNPVDEQFIIEFTLKTDGLVNLTINDLLGSKILSKSNNMKIGQNHFVVDFSTFDHGIYFYTISVGSFHYFGKLLK